MNKKIENYIEKQSSSQKEICEKLRKIVLKAFLGIKEEINQTIEMERNKIDGIIEGCVE